MSTELLRNPTNIGDIFFSGSQTVIKGQQVTWILDDTWAFKATEDCGVSTNASPFVNLRAGQTFLIYKRTQADIDAGNTKGIYIFDRDTIVALAYPQEVTQDIIIENDNYNNNINNIDVIVEAADKSPKAIISVNNAKPVEGEVVTVSGASSYYYAPATSLTYQWHLNGSNKGTGSTFTFTAQARQYDIDLTVTDNKGLKNDKKMTVYGQAKVTYPTVEINLKGKGYVLNVGSGVYSLLREEAGQIATGTTSINASVSLNSRSTRHGAKIRMTVKKNGTTIGTTDRFIDFGTSGLIQLIKNIGNTSVKSSDIFTVTVERIEDTGNYDATNAQLYIKIQP